METATTLDLVLWGHSLAEYQRMFDLTAADFDKKLLDCASGFTSANLELHQQHKQMVSCDQHYGRSPAQLEAEIEKAFVVMAKQVKHYEARFIWKDVANLEALINLRKKRANAFLQDYPQGLKEKRYVGAKLPKLPFKDHEFELALCSHFLFTTSSLSVDFHHQAIVELTRVAAEARFFPLLDHTGEISSLLGPLMLSLQQHNYGVEVRQVPYELQHGGNAMLRVWSNECAV